MGKVNRQCLQITTFGRKRFRNGFELSSIKPSRPNDYTATVRGCLLVSQESLATGLEVFSTLTNRPRSSVRCLKNPSSEDLSSHGCQALACLAPVISVHPQKSVNSYQSCLGRGELTRMRASTKLDWDGAVIMTPQTHTPTSVLVPSFPSPFPFF